MPLANRLVVPLLLGVCMARPALAMGDGAIEYMSIQSGPGGGYTRFEGDHPIGEQRFFTLLVRSQADPDLVARIEQDKAWRSSLGWGALGLLALAPAAGGMLAVNYPVNPKGVYSTTYLGLTVGTVAGGLGLGIAYLLSALKPLYTRDDVTHAVHAYNRRLDALDSQPAIPSGAISNR